MAGGLPGADTYVEFIEANLKALLGAVQASSG
jgi:hypothetical protein